MKKNKLWLWILLGLALVAAIAAGVILLTSGQQQQEPEPAAYESKIYLNVERARYVAQGYYGVSSRVPDSDGYYRVNMAVDGEQTEVLVSDANLINRMDFQELMGLTFDENGIVNGILELDEFTGGIAANKFVVVSVLGNKVVCNTSPKYKGIDVTFELNDDTKFWQMGDFEAMMGLPTYIAEGDQVIMIRDKSGNISDVYVNPFVPPGDVYWNITRMFDTEGQVSTRERDSLGFFVYEFAVNGEIKTLRTRDQDIANLIDKHASQAMGLVFDDNGDIIEVLNAGNTVCGGGLLCNRYAVTAIDGSDFTVKLGQNSYNASLSKDCKYFDVSGSSDYMGKAVDGIQLGDKVTVLKDRKDQVCVVYITNRLTDNDIYWVVERNDVWNRTTWTTDRKPASDGWYYIKLAGNGKQITAKTKDAELVNELDSYVCWCVELDGDEIVGIQDAANRYGGSLFGAFNQLIKIDGDKLTIQKTTTTASATMAEDCLVYNVSTAAVTVGEPTSIRQGDTIYGFTDLDGVVRYIFVTSTTFDGELYWNTQRLYDDKTKQSTRKLGADGYYHYEMICNGKTVWLKTSSKEIANKIDLVKTRVRGLKLDGDIILDVLAPEKLSAYQGVKPDVGWKTVTAVSGNRVTINDNGKSRSFTMASNCKVYNMTNAFRDHKGENTTVQVGDTIVTLVNEAKQAVRVYVCGNRTRTFHITKQSCACEDKVTWKPWDGKSELTGGYYRLTKNIVAPEGGFVVSNATVNLRLDGHTIKANKGPAFVAASGSVISICDHKTRGAIIGAGDGRELSGVFSVENSNAVVDIYNIDIYSIGGTVDNGGVIGIRGWLSLYNVNVYGGHATRKGGNIAILPSGTLRMFGGSLKNGTAELDADNLLVAGNAYLENVNISGGIAASVNEKHFIINGANVSGGNYGIKLQAGQLTLAGAVIIRDNIRSNLHLSQDTRIVLDSLTQDSKIGIRADIAGVICDNAKQKDVLVFENDDPDMQVTYADGKLMIRAEHTHGLCQGSPEIGFTKLTQSMFDNATVSSAPVRLSGSNFVLEGGNYYLGQDITLPTQILVYDTVNLCLNGYTMTAASRSFALIGASMSIADCKQTGSIIGGTAGNAANILIQGSKGGSNGTAGELNVYGGTLVGGTTTATNGAHGGNVQVYFGTMNLYGGVLIGGTAKASGGTVYLNPGQNLNIYGGQILSGTAATGNCVMVTEGSHVSLSGLVKVDQLYLNDQITVTDLMEGTTIGVFAPKAGIIAQNLEQDWSDMFVCSADNAVVYNTADKTLRYTYDHMHCICNGLNGHTCEEQAWIGLTQTDILNGNYSLDATNHYYLKEDIQLTSHLHIGAQKTLNLCLNGYTITAPDAARVCVIAGGTLNLTDCQKTGAFVAKKASTGGAVLVQGSGGGAMGAYMGTFNMYGGTIYGGEVTLGGAVAVTGGTMNLYAGTLTGGNATKNGGTLYVEKGQNLYLYGGRITSGTAAVGPCLYADVETNITLNGVEVLEAVYLNGTQLVVKSVGKTFTTQINAAASGVLIQNIEESVAAQFTTVPENTLSYDPKMKTLSLALPSQFTHGHCLCNGFEGHACTVHEWTGLTANDVLTGNFIATADHYYYLTEDVVMTSPITLSGPDTVLNLCLGQSTLTAPANNRAFVINGATLNLTACQDSGKVVGGQYTKNGGMFYVQGVSGNKGEKGQLNLYGGTLQGGTAGNGGVAYISWGGMSVYGGTIQGGTVTNAAAAIWVNNGQSLNLFGGQILFGTGAKKGNCVLAMQDSVITVGGNAQVDEIYLNKAGLQLQVSSQHPLTDSARIGVQMLTPGVVTDLEEYIEDTFICRNAGMELYWDPETKKLTMVELVSNIDEQDEQ